MPGVDDRRNKKHDREKGERVIMADNDLLTIKQVAEVLSCHQMTVRRIMDAGELGPITRLGRRAIRISSIGLELYIINNTAAPHG